MPDRSCDSVTGFEKALYTMYDPAEGVPRILTDVFPSGIKNSVIRAAGIVQLLALGKAFRKKALAFAAESSVPY